jgi:alkanesulfonate monooxygenase SsuD/methylene tetrahydromethanopterin reductase-like flavin-dependent oxidoreductase (luciferase family)
MSATSITDTVTSAGVSRRARSSKDEWAEDELPVTEPQPSHGLGITAGLDSHLASDLAVRCAQLGYDSLWANDEPAAPGLETLAHFAAAAPQLDLGVGVLPLDRYRPAQIAADIDRLGLDPAKLWLGIGSGQLRHQLDAVRHAVAELRNLLPKETRIVVAAMRPELCRLGGAVADGVLLNWMPPDQAARARRWVLEGAEDERVTPPLTALYVRVAVGSDASQRLRIEEGRYRTINEGHRKHFAAMDVPPGSVGIAASGRRALLDGLQPYRSAVELPIARVLAHADTASLIAVAEAAAPY